MTSLRHGACAAQCCRSRYRPLQVNLADTHLPSEGARSLGVNWFSGRGLVLSLEAALSPFWEQMRLFSALKIRLLTSGRKMAAPRGEKGRILGIPSFWSTPRKWPWLEASALLPKGMEGRCPSGAHFTGTVSFVLY
ncbi:hypothetical protein HJG60_011026 [Phyllostomus discolor]|uniref:Uncharacterized protein n=1 Tax=Phyllostomus discolor TaxID=89673 RepID=A0A834AHX4_9CHIR|nr:hypothetical protein HJG60_011026 [Phyllostomus discolor]